MERGIAMRLFRTITGLLLLLGGGGVMAAPQIEYLVSAPNDNAGIRSDWHLWELRDSLGRFFNYRMVVTDQSGFRYKDEDRIVHNLTTDGRGIAVLLDWHPLAGGFRVSSGVVDYKQTLNYVVAANVDETLHYDIKYNVQEAADDLAEKVAEYGYTMEDLRAYLPDDMLSRKIRFSKHVKISPQDIFAYAKVNYELPAPYFGMGWSSPFNSSRRLSYSFDIGVLYQVDPEIDMLVQGNMVDSAEPAVISWLNEWTFEEKQEMHEKLDKRRLSPRLGFGLSYRLF
jgi:hypothetical protein